jgi:uncharacterized membrane protein
MFHDFLFVFNWWLLILGLGLICLPLTFYFFANFFDRGYIFSKILGILILSYLTWLLGSSKILPFTQLNLFLIVVFLLLVNFFFLKKSKLSFKKIIKEKWRFFVGEEILFLLGLVFWSGLRSFQPDIQGLEKFMDFGFINSILKSRFFPPADMWLAGQTINYYYFGHLVSAVLTKLSGLNPAITYNLMMATLFGLTFSTAFSLSGNFIFTLKKQLKIAVLGGLLTAFFLSLGGNLHPFWYFFTHQFSLAGYWYPDATRFIVELFGAADNTIHEFPLYSFVVSDLHGHLLNLPFVLLFVGLVFSFYRQKELKISLLVLLSLLLAVFYMTNAWDVPIYLCLFGLVLLLVGFQKWGWTLKTFYQTLLRGVICLLLAFLFSLPFHFHFKSIVGGVGLTDFHSPFWMLLVLWGFPLGLTLAFYFFLKKKKLNQTDDFLSIILFVAWFLILLPEFFYLKDIYIHSYQRANTMFKLTYQSFVMFSLTIPYIFIRLSGGLKKKLLRYGFVFLFLFLAFFIFAYPYFAIRSYYGLKNYRGLNGLSYLQNLYPDDYQAILWLRENVSSQPVIVEAVGESYTDYARVSANTGLPTLLGWRVHEWLWRGGFDEPGKRTEEVRMIYESSDINQIQKLLGQYQVRYLFLGNLEREAYPQLKEMKFYQLGEVVFSSGQTKVFQLNDFPSNP